MTATDNSTDQPQDAPEQVVTAEAGTEQAADAPEQPEQPELSLEEQLEQAQAALAEANDAALRAAAEAQNARRRAEKEVENARKFALERFAGELLPVADNLDRAVEAASGDDSEGAKAVLEGVELTRKSLADTLARNGVQQLDPVGEPFDPQFHEAIVMQPSPDAEPNSVLNVVQKGYSLNGRLLRAAMVVVAKAPE